jgi:hypothetical protein
MSAENPFQNPILYDLFETILPDFVLAFAFFTSVIYAVLAKRFERQRPAIMTSASIGIALSIGLIWWEQSTGLSTRNLGPTAVGFAIIVIAFVMYQAFRQVGGSWAGACISFAAAILIAGLFLPIPLRPDVINTVTTVALIVGILFFLSKTHDQPAYLRPSRPNRSDIRHDMSDLYQDQWVSDRLTGKLDRIRREATTLPQRPERTAEVLVQLKRILPAEGWLTDRMARLRAKAHQIRNGHIAKLEETQFVFSRLPASAKKQAAAELMAGYNQLSGIDSRLERLDKAVTEIELRIRNLTAAAQRYARRGEHKKLYETLKSAERLQYHNSKLIRTIERTEASLSAVAKKVADEVKQIEERNQ